MSVRSAKWTTSLLAAAIAMFLAVFARAESDGDAPTGRALFVQKGCIGCHGVDARGGFGPALAATALRFDEVLNQLRHPRHRMPMFPLAIVSDTEARAIYDYVRSLGGVASTAQAPASAAERAPTVSGVQAKAKAAKRASRASESKVIAESPDEATAPALPADAAPLEARAMRWRGGPMFHGRGMGCRHW